MNTNWANTPHAEHEGIETKEQQQTDFNAYLTLSVVNVHQLEVGLAATYTFDNQGGTIGASPKDTWVLRDNEGSIQLSHAHVFVSDGFFCLMDLSGLTFINGAIDPIGLKKSIRCSDKDLIQIGQYQIRANLVVKDELDIHHLQGLEQAFSGEAEALIKTEPRYKPSDEIYLSTNAELDPLAALDASFLTPSPLSMLEDKKEPSLLFDEFMAEEKPASIMVQADSEYELGAAMVLKKTSKAPLPLSHDALMEDKHGIDTINYNEQKTINSMDNHLLEKLEEEIEHSFSEQLQAASAAGLYGEKSSAMGDTQHALVGPLLKGLGAEVSQPNNMAKMQALSEELGASLQAAIKGLLALHAHVEDSPFGVMNKNLQPIEDNPLRLGLSYQNTIQTLFDGQQSLVHLSAPSAIEESLTHVIKHNEAVLFATTEALTQILDAFSPPVLMRRFAAYRRKGQHLPLSEEAWAWGMYQNYYQELVSNRQKGFEKLFWEIFQQAYDKKIRERRGDD